ncbi:hypothetical protein GGF32_005348 [Allomyces javanicus]|nr:hypothetical protein GGF32_005348 [Allomyces javanicus]
MVPLVTTVPMFEWIVSRNDPILFPNYFLPMRLFDVALKWMVEVSRTDGIALLRALFASPHFDISTRPKHANGAWVMGLCAEPNVIERLISHPSLLGGQFAAQTNCMLAVARAQGLEHIVSMLLEDLTVQATDRARALQKHHINACFSEQTRCFPLQHIQLIHRDYDMMG